MFYEQDLCFSHRLHGVVNLHRLHRAIDPG